MGGRKKGKANTTSPSNGISTSTDAGPAPSGTASPADSISQPPGIATTWNKFKKITAEIGAVVAAIALLWFLFSTYQTIQQTSTSVADLGKKIDGVDRRLIFIEAQNSLKRLTESNVTNNEQSFENALREVKQNTAEAREKKVALPPVTVSEASTALANIPDRTKNPDLYWQAAAELVNYRSAMMNLADAAKNFPECDIPMSFGGKLVKQDPDSGAHLPVLPEDDLSKGIHDVVAKKVSQCTIRLDGRQMRNVVFDRCLIIYSGGPVNINQSVEFRNCLFRFAFQRPPRDDGRLFAQNVLRGAFGD